MFVIIMHMPYGKWQGYENNWSLSSHRHICVLRHWPRNNDQRVDVFARRMSMKTNVYVVNTKAFDLFDLKMKYAPTH